MTRQRQTLMAMTAAALITVAGATIPAAAQTPAPKLQPAFRGEAQVAMTAPAVKRTEKELVTTFKVKNLMKQPLAGFKIEEFWYDAKGTVVGGDTFRNPKPIQPDEIITITLTDPLTGKEKNNNYKFSHANGTVKPTKVPKLP